MSSTPPRATARPRTGRRPLTLVAGVLVTVAAVAFTLDAFGVGRLFYAISAAALITVFCFAAVLRGVRPVRVWLPQMLAGVCFLTSLAANWVQAGIGPASFVDIFYFLGYALLVVWLGMLTVHVGRREPGTVLDTIAVTVGALLLVWIILVVPMADGARLPAGVAVGLYPAIDLTLLALAVNLARRLRRRVVAMEVFLLVLALQLALDVAYGVTHVVAPGSVRPLLACYLFTYLGFAVAASHPSVRDLTPPPVDAAEEVPRRPTALVLFTISPAILATSVPLDGGVDVVLRPLLVAALLVLVFVRLTRTMQALAGAEARSRHRAAHDPLTGLLNRSSLFDTLTARLARNARRGTSTAVVFLDCDDFKHVNDTWGHGAGDELLRQIAARLSAALDPGEALARNGGDEFVVVADVSDTDAALDLAERLRSSLTAAPLAVSARREHAVTATTGLALAAPGEDVGAEELLWRADVAMYEAKSTTRGRVVVFGEDLAARSRLRATIGDRLAAAIAAEEFRVHLQPIRGGVDYGRTLAWEALARWHEPELGMVPPDVFIGLAEEHGLIGDLGELVLRQACADLVRIRRERPELGEVAVSVNVSPVQLLDPGFGDTVRRCAREAGLPLQALWLEVTETMLVDTGPHVLATICELREEGVLFLIDDFGTGYASLSTLLRLPVDDVKLDRSLVARLGQEDAATRQLAAVMALVRSLGIENVLAEGVETVQQADVLRRLDCPLAQGWLFGRPAPVEDVLASLARESVS